jgi:hypothetical protein
LSDLGPALQGNPLAWVGEEIADLRRRLADLERTPALAREGVIDVDATTGFLFVPVCHGTPGGAPVDFGGSPLVYDDVGHKLWAYRGGIWRAVTFT